MAALRGAPARPAARHATRSARRTKVTAAAYADARRGKSSSSPPPPASLADKLQAVYRIFFPRKEPTPRAVVKDRLACILSVDRSGLQDSQAAVISEKVKGIMQDYVELADGEDFEQRAEQDRAKVVQRYDESLGRQVYMVSFRVKRVKPTIDSGLRERGQEEEWARAFGEMPAVAPLGNDWDDELNVARDMLKKERQEEEEADDAKPTDPWNKFSVW